MSNTCPTAPSSASVCGVFDGEPGAWPKFLAHWLLRSALIMPGLAIAGIRDKRIITGSLASSTLISVFLMLYTAVERGRRGQSASQPHRLRGRRRPQLRSALKHHWVRKQLADPRRPRRVSALEMFALAE